MTFEALLGEAEVVAGRVACPRSAPDCLANFEVLPAPDDWIVAGVCAYVPQVGPVIYTIFLII